jgi:hypothetical protein
MCTPATKIPRPELTHSARSTSSSKQYKRS